MVAVTAAFAALGGGVHHNLRGGTSAALAPPAGAGAAAAAQPSGPPQGGTGGVAAVAPGAGTGTDDGSMDVGDVLEPMAAQLADLLEHLRDRCAAARRQRGVPAPSIVASCADAGEATMSTVELVRGTLASAAGRDAPGSVRDRWARDLGAATAEVRASLTPVQESLGRVLASGTPSPAAFRDLAHLRDRIARVLTRVEQP